MPSSDWTHGPAKYAAVALLGAASLGGIGYSLATGRTPWRTAATAAPATIDADAPPPLKQPAATIALKININTADRAELELLPGIGPALAERIIEDRQRAGPFKRLEDLGRVKGIGPKTIERLRDLATID